MQHGIDNAWKWSLELKIERREKQGTNATHLFQYFILLAGERKERSGCVKSVRESVYSMWLETILASNRVACQQSSLIQSVIIIIL
jgi:hypothetical protein